MKLKEMRINKGMTFTEACKKAKIASSSLSRYENLKRFPNNQILNRIQKIYNLSNSEIADLFLDYYKGEQYGK